MYTFSLVAITPAAFKPTAEALGAAMGHSGSEFNVPLYTGETLSHYGLHAWVTPATAAIWLGEAYPTTPDGQEGTEYTEEQIDAVRSQLVISCLEGVVPREHFDTVLSENGLSEETAEETPA